MGVAREHKGHSGDAARRISAAFEHYATRASRRPRQTWEQPVECYHASAQPCAEDFELHHIVQPYQWVKR